MALPRRGSQTTERPASDSQYTNLTENEYEGRLVYVADLGLQEREYKGEVKPPAQQVSLGIEILGVPVEVDGAEKPRVLWTKPFNVFYSMNEKGNEMKYYKVFEPTATEGEVADWDKVLGKPCNVMVVQTNGKGDKSDNVYDNIDTLTPIPAKYQDAVAAATVANPAVGDADDDVNPATAALYGLAKFVWDKRINGGSAKASTAVHAVPDMLVDNSAPF